MQPNAGEAKAGAKPPRIMVTDNGPHPPHKWGAVTADMLLEGLFDVSDEATPAARSELRDFKYRLQASLTEAYSRAMFHTYRDCQEGLCTQDVDTHLAAARDLIMTENLCGMVRDAAHGLRFHNRMYETAVLDHVRERLTMDLATIILIEHRWFQHRSES